MEMKLVEDLDDYKEVVEMLMRMKYQDDHEVAKKLAILYGLLGFQSIIIAFDAVEAGPLRYAWLFSYGLWIASSIRQIVAARRALKNYKTIKYGKFDGIEKLEVATPDKER